MKTFVLKIRNILCRLKRVTPAKLKNYINWKTVNGYDAFCDRRITGLNLTKTEPTPGNMLYRGTVSQPTRYLILKRVFSHITLSKSDVFVDVGCGKGRCIAFLLSQHCPCQIYGVELSEIPGKIAVAWTKKYPNVHVKLGDAFAQNYDRFTVLYLSQPFFPETFHEFVHLLETQLTHPITFIYLFDHASGGYLEGRAGWELQYREEFFRIHGLQVAGAVRRFSIWTYTPPFL